MYDYPSAIVKHTVGVQQLRNGVTHVDRRVTQRFDQKRGSQGNSESNPQVRVIPMGWIQNYHTSTCPLIQPSQSLLKSESVDSLMSMYSFSTLPFPCSNTCIVKHTYSDYLVTYPVTTRSHSLSDHQ